MSNSIISLVGSSFADILSSIDCGASNLGGAALSEALGRIMRGRAEQARKILLDEIRHCHRPCGDPGEIDEFVAIMYRYMRAAQEGTSRLNLRLMARVVRSQIELEGLYASEFLRYADMIASLSREEVVLLATRYRERLAFDKLKQTSNWDDTKRVNANVLKAVVPDVFPTEMDLAATMTALQRTGLIWAAAMEIGGGPIWQDTPLHDQIVSLAEFESIVNAEQG